MPKASLSFVSREVCRRLVDVGQVVRRIEEVYRWEAEGQVLYADQVALRLFHPESSFKTHTKAVILPPLAVAGVRVVGYRVGEDGSGPSSPESTRLVILMDLQSGNPLALVDEHYNYTLRTAASVGVAARYLSPARPRLGLVGAGGVARDVARVFSEVLALEHIQVTSRRKASRRAFVEDLAPRLAVPLEAADSLEQILENNNVVVTATTTRDTLIRPAQVAPGVLLCALGSFELAPEVYASASKVLVDDWDQTRSAHDMKPVIESGTLTRDTLYAELGEVVSGRKAGRETEQEVIVVRTEGMPSQDVALAHWVYREALRHQMTTSISGE